MPEFEAKNKLSFDDVQNWEGTKIKIYVLSHFMVSFLFISPDNLKKKLFNLILKLLHAKRLPIKTLFIMKLRFFYPNGQISSSGKTTTLLVGTNTKIARSQKVYLADHKC